MTASESEIVREITKAVLKNYIYFKINSERRQIINADLIPKYFEKTEEIVERKEPEIRIIPKPIIPKNNIRIIRPILVRPVASMPPFQSGASQVQHVQTIIQKPIENENILQNMNMEIEGDYGKITLLLKDPSVSAIECLGADQNIIVTRAGQRQQTKITLNSKEINSLLEDISKKAKIPLLEGIFKAAVENFMINAVISGIVGSRFVIRKQTPYSLLER